MFSRIVTLSIGLCSCACNYCCLLEVQGLTISTTGDQGANPIQFSSAGAPVTMGHALHLVLGQWAQRPPSAMGTFVALPWGCIAGTLDRIGPQLSYLLELIKAQLWRLVEELVIFMAPCF